MLKCFEKTEIDSKGVMTVQVIATNYPHLYGQKSDEVHKEVLLKSLHVPMGVKLALRNVNLKGKIYYMTNYIRNYND